MLNSMDSYAKNIPPPPKVRMEKNGKAEKG